MSGITLYEYNGSRSARVRWVLLELNIPFESVNDRALIRSEQLSEFSPLGKLPALTDDGRALFESAAIATWLADSHPEGGLSFPSGSWERALHDQWVSFVLTEIEAHIWSTARNTFVYPDEDRLPIIFDQNNSETRRGLAVLDDHLAGNEYLVGGKFSVTDIIAGYAVNWSRRQGLTSDFANVSAYLTRLQERPHCPLARD